MKSTPTRHARHWTSLTVGSAKGRRASAQGWRDIAEADRIDEMVAGPKDNAAGVSCPGLSARRFAGLRLACGASGGVSLGPIGQGNGNRPATYATYRGASSAPRGDHADVVHAAERPAGAKVHSPTASVDRPRRFAGQHHHRANTVRRGRTLRLQKVGRAIERPGGRACSGSFRGCAGNGDEPGSGIGQFHAASVHRHAARYTD